MTARLSTPSSRLLPAIALTAAAVLALGHSAIANRSTRSAAASAAQPAAQSAGDIQRFKEEFERALQFSQYPEMADLVKANHHAALFVVIETCEAIGEQTSEKLERRVDGLRKAWQRAYNDERFVDNVYEYLALMRASFRTHRLDMKKRWLSNQAEFHRAREEKDVNAFPGLGVEFKLLAEGFEEINDAYHAAEAWRYAAYCSEEDNVGDKYDFDAVVALLEKFMANREKVDLRDVDYNELKARRGALIADGWGVIEEELTEEHGGEEDADGTPTGATGGGAAKGKAAPTEAAVLSATMSFELVDDFAAYERPAYHADDIVAMWQVIGLGERGATNTIYMMADSPSLVRTGEISASVDTDGDGEGDIEIPVTGNIESVEFPVGQGDDARPWGMLVAIGNERNKYQGIDLNLSPTPQALNLYVFNAASVVGDLGGTAIRIFDDNLDGNYGTFGITWSLDGLAEGNYHPQVDSMILGRGKKAVPFSEFIQLGDDWYKLEPKKHGMELEAKLHKDRRFRTGRLALDAKGIKPDYLIVRGSGDYLNCYFDLTEGGKKGLEVPIGEYKIFAGRISKGKRLQVMKALILAGDGPGVVVKQDELAELAIGEPLSFDFVATGNGEEVTVDGSTVVVQGRGGEVYDRVWNAVTRPDVSTRKKGKGKGSKGKGMRVVENQLDPILAVEGYGAMWRPLDFVITQPDAEFEVRLTEKKNKLFGSIDSDWR